jgi:lipoprotein-anchoring transpeptidase ErfK/SrfK
MMFLITLVCVAVSAAFIAAILEDHLDRDVLLPGADVYGVKVGGYRVATAVALVARDVATPLLRPLVVEYGGQRWTLATQKMAKVDTQGMVRSAYAKAYSPRPVWVRVYHRVADEPAPVRVELKFRYRDNRVQAFVRSLRRVIDRPTVDSAQLVVGKRVLITSSQTGRELNLGITRARIRSALPKGVRVIQPAIRESSPRATRSTFKKALVVVKSERTLYLYDGDKLEKTFPIAVGTPGHPTPEGDWHIVLKRFMPTWVNPGSAWAAGMPQSIAPGYSNPLGTRALDLDASGIRIHGTANDYSVGTAASHGCMRMHMPDIEDLYERVEVGTPVFIKPDASIS